MDNWLFRLIHRLIPVAIIVASIALIAVIVLIFMPVWAKSFTYLRESVTALSTAAMVIATLLLAHVTFNVINSDRQREERNRKERLLNEIIEWATKSAESAIYRQKIDGHELWKAKLNYKNCRAKSEYIKGIAASSFPTLNSQINGVVTKLDEAIQGTTKFIDSKLNADYNLMRTSEEGLTNVVIELFKEAAKIKSRDIS